MNVDLLIQEARLASGEVRDIAISAGVISVLRGGGTSSGESGEAARRVLPAEGRLVLPGLVNAHTHLDKALLSARVKNVTGTVDEARLRMKEAKSAFTVADIRRRAGVVLERCVVDGVTALRSHVDVDPIVGLKGVEALLSLRESMSDVVDLQLVAFPQEGIHQHPGTADLMREALRMGVDVVGGHLSIASDPEATRRETDTVFELAAEFGRDIDVHVDHSIDLDYAKPSSPRADGKVYPQNLGVVYLAEATIREGYQGRVTASHLCGLDGVPPTMRSDVIELLLRANVAVVVLPASNMYTQGRGDRIHTRRGVTRLLELKAAGVRVAVGTDNIRDAFSPFVNGDLIQNAVFASLACHLVSAADLRLMLELETSAAAEIMSLPGYGLEPGCRADLVLLSARSWDDVLDGDAARNYVVKRGVVCATTTVTRTLHREARG